MAPAEVNPEAKETVEAPTVIPEEYKYDARGRRDPFLSLVAVTKEKQIKKKGASPFESYDINEIKLLAIAWDKNKYFALIRLPDKKDLYHYRRDVPRPGGRKSGKDHQGFGGHTRIYQGLQGRYKTERYNFETP